MTAAPGSGQGGTLPPAPGQTAGRGGGSRVFNPNAPATQGAGDAASIFLQGLFSNPQAFAQGMSGLANPLQQQAVGNIGSFLNQQAPEMRALMQSQPALQSLLGGQRPQQAGGPQGVGFEAGQRTIAAAQPVFQQNLQGALTQVANRAPSVNNSAFGQESSGLAQRALQDFNLFQQQALQQGLGQDLQAQQIGNQFALGSAGLAQQGQLGGLSALANMSAQAGQNPFARMLDAGQFGAQLTDQAINPTLQLLLGGMQFGKQNPLELMVPQQGGGVSGVLGGLLGAGLGAFTGGLGGNLADNLFG